MKNRQLRYLLVVVLISVGGFFAGNTVTSAASTSGADSTATVEFYGKKNTPNNNGDNNGSKDSGVRNERLPQTGEFVLPNVSLYGYALIAVGMSWILVSRKRNSED